MKKGLSVDICNVPVFILAGGFGTRLREQTEFRPKPMVEVGNHPILWHIMSRYSLFGFRKFVICTGFKSEVIKDYFLNYHALNSDFTVDLTTNAIRYHGIHHNERWEVTVAYTGNDTMTGGRVGRAAERYLGNAEHFALTYGDGLTDVDLRREFEFHVAHKKIGTMLAVNAHSRFGEIIAEDNTITRFNEKPDLPHSLINGGYFFFRRDFTRYLSTEGSLILEREPLTKLAADRQLQVYRHGGFWACMDSQREKEYLDELWKSGKAPWLQESKPGA